MANRPCKTDSDLKRLWRALLPGMPLPACGTAKDEEASAEQKPEPVSAPHREAERRDE